MMLRRQRSVTSTDSHGTPAREQMAAFEMYPEVRIKVHVDDQKSIQHMSKRGRISKEGITTSLRRIE